MFEKNFQKYAGVQQKVLLIRNKYSKIKTSKKEEVVSVKKLPYGISDYESLVENNYYYVDKTIYIEKLENLAERYIMFLRPRKFGKILFIG